MRGRWSVLQKRSSGKPWLQLLWDDQKEVLQSRSLKLEGQKTEHSLVHKVRLLIRRTWMPEGSPESVHPNFFPFTWWNFTQGLAGSAAGVLSTQCLLVGLNATSTAAASGMMAASLNWILKDGIGNLGSILFVSKFGSSFDKHSKRYRFLSSICLNIATALEIMVPLLSAGYFIPVASAANMAKGVAWMASSATRAQIQRHMALKDNLGDVTGKTASLMTASNVLGMGFGLLLSSSLITSTENLVLNCFLVSIPLMAISLYASYRSCLLAISPNISLQRFNIIMEGLIPNLSRKSIADPLYRYIRDPTNVSKKERFLYWPGTGFKLAQIRFEPSINRLPIKTLDNMKRFATFFQQYGFIATYDKKGLLSVWFNETMISQEIITRLVAVYLAKHKYEREGSQDWFDCLADSLNNHVLPVQDELIQAFKARGWDCDNFDWPRRPIIIGQLPESSPIT